MTNHVCKITISKRAKRAQGLERHRNALIRVRTVARTWTRMHRKNDPHIMPFPSYFAGLLLTGCFAFVPMTLAKGGSGGHMSGMGSHQHGPYYDPIWGPSAPYQASSYNSAYFYTPTPEQQAGAKQQVEAYLIAVKKHRKHAATHRYISVETVKPTKKQLEDFTRKQPPARPVEPGQLHCLMVYDTQTREFVGSGCYVVSTEPSAGTVSKFESVSAEFVGHQTL